MKKFVISNIEGNTQTFQKLLKKAGFDYNKDLIILLGNCMNITKHEELEKELGKIKNIVYCLGAKERIMLRQGINIRVFKESLNYFVYDDCLFMHEGFNPNNKLNEQSKNFNFDKRLIKLMESNNIEGYDKIFTSRLPTQKIERDYINYKCRQCLNEWEEQVEKKELYKLNQEKVACDNCGSGNVFQSLGCTKPIKIGNLYCINTGHSWNGKLTLFNFDNEVFYQSELQEPLN